MSAYKNYLKNLKYEIKNIERFKEFVGNLSKFVVISNRYEDCVDKIDFTFNNGICSAKTRLKSLDKFNCFENQLMGLIDFDADGKKIVKEFDYLLDKNTLEIREDIPGRDWKEYYIINSYDENNKNLRIGKGSVIRFIENKLLNKARESILKGKIKDNNVLYARQDRLLSSYRLFGWDCQLKIHYDKRDKYIKLLSFIPEFVLKKSNSVVIIPIEGKIPDGKFEEFQKIFGL